MNIWHVIWFVVKEVPSAPSTVTMPPDVQEVNEEPGMSYLYLLLIYSLIDDYCSMLCNT